ncbi:MAG: cytochrome c maturation protein CcmE [gamma proteobacterium symbiont of Bathyaustriella thionipta]|nr:cytochrome c maturation protein CcmE [gamma proteobacterium symbiont of Bathyaustriella thionipta]MCU7950293.1 cytochrome c maturation protein CcmE [gamma proteobacterium symbiont of Bathyaustriella thionipta]MCU7954444.1 cytochrome c maturation protein CcmE [gamma proteobacterium symbiont of Bathyaustriella thionipta]MCU7956809.1 cytochrome c maturation protein CcmE [gamma proteobacterium symbiont of Bathyaustriella thionipta]MCU7968655.1 cytochrome c maturation protein CcmE [gamma proteoba
MNPKRKNRLILVFLILAGVGAAVTLGLKALDQNLLYFFSPTQVKAGEAPMDHSFRLGGLVTDGSVKREKDGMTIHFDITDNAETIAVTYTGILPDLFREGQGIVATGKLDGTSVDGPEGKLAHFVADEVLAKHDENYMPPEVQDALDKAHVEGKKAMAEAASAKVETSGEKAQ